ncbi:hypothetical protein P389DRAFT_76999 [Cystobasidium minutum MCA 4210]|uniref:uncharacterized protein n=1 Tax=Cystobasidium minutum MCA 4210 TaxID=1397322 RepID=UPI0034CD5E27|eukprot:jgi/Rhomi1/76999/CE76998_404
MGDIPPWLGDRLWPASRFLGYRPVRYEIANQDPDPSERGRFLPLKLHNHPKFSGTSRTLARLRENSFVQKVLEICRSFVGSFIGVALVAVMARSQPFLRRRAPVVLASFGAEAVLLYASPTSPVVQPRNIMIGNCMSAVIGVALAKGFTQLSDFTIEDNGNVNWAAASLAIACAIAVMQIFYVVHPPGGASAVLPVTIAAVYNLNWFYIAQIAGASGIMLAWGLIINNIGKGSYPTFWISPVLAEKVKKQREQQLPEKRSG